MSTKKIKLSLKNAKQAIQAKDFEAALNHCQEVLDDDPLNYNGLVFAGLCHSELKHHDLALTTYQKAIESQPEMVLAYQGIVNLFIKHSMKGNSEQMPVVILAYKFLINRSKLDLEKKVELQHGLSQAYCENDQYDLAFKTLDEALQKIEKGSASKKSPLQITFLRCLKMSVAFANQSQIDPEMVFNTATDFLQNADVPGEKKLEPLKHLILFLQAREGCLVKYLLVLEKLCLEVALNNTKINMFAEMVLQICLQKDQLSTDAASSVLNFYDGSYKSIFQAFSFFNHNRLDDCEKQIREGLANASDFVPGWLLLCKCLNKMHKGQEAEKAVKQGLQALKNFDQCNVSGWVVHLKPMSELKVNLTMCLGTAYSLQHNPTSLALAKATFEKLSKIQEHSKQATLGLIAVEMKLNNFDRVKDILSRSPIVTDNLQAKCWKAQLQFMDGDREGAVATIIALAQDNPKELLPTFLSGKLMWQLGESYRRDKTKCLTAFLKAAKLDVYHGETFLYLGHYYRDIGNDKVKAKKCYQKAYALDPGKEEAGSALADQYIAEGKFEDAVSLYEGVTDDAAAGTCKWAWLRLGLCHLKIKDGNKAIKCFLAALRADANDYICWECLGEGYIGRGSYNAAWKAFNKAHELNPNSVYSVYQMAAVKQILGQHEEAIVEYMDVLKMVPDYVPALKGLSESHFSQAKQMLSEGRDQTSIDHITEAIKCLTSAISTSGTMSCLWKLLGECCTVIYFLHPTQVQVEVPSVLHSQSSSPSGSVTLNKKELLSLGTKCFSRALSLQNNLSSLWHDLGLNLFHRAKEESELSLATQLAEKSQNVLQKAVSLEPNNHILWNSLGVVAASKYIENWALAQHSFIKSIEADGNNCWAWSNLGFMYLLQRDVQLAHRAFKVAQSLEPAFPNSWIGQATVAEEIESHEAMDLFRHATELGLHGQSGIGYASWVVRLIMECDDRSKSRYRENIHAMNAIQTTQTQLFKYCIRHPDCAWALTLHGFILEQSGLNRSAEEAYKRAMEILQSDHAKCDESTLSLAANLDKAKSNYARLVSLNGNFSKAAETYRSILSPTFHDRCGLALVLRQSNKLKEALQTYQEACRMVATDDDQANVSVAMATLSFHMKNFKEAKELLLPWIKSSNVARQTLEAIDIARGSPLTENLTTEDLSFTSRDQLRNCLLDVASSLRRDRASAYRTVQKYIHRFPNEWRFRLILSHMIQRRIVDVPISLSHCMARNGFQSYSGDIACSSINRDLVHQSGAESLENHRRMITALACSVLSSGNHRFKSSDVNKRSGDDALKSAQRLVHCHPYSAESWSVLSASCYANSVYAKLKKQPDNMHSICLRLSSYLEQNSLSKELGCWSTKQKFLSLLAGENYNEVIDVASEITDDFEENDVYVTLSECALELVKNGSINKSQIKEFNNIATSKSSSLHSKMIASHALKCVGMYKEAHSVLSSALSAGSPSSDQRLRLALRSFEVAFTAAQNSSPDDIWISLCSEAINAAKREESQAATILAEGLCRYLEKNHRKCRVMLNRALDSAQWYRGGELCMGRSVAAWYLYRNLHERNDAMEMEKLLEKWSDDPLLIRIRKLLQ